MSSNTLILTVAGTDPTKPNERACRKAGALDLHVNLLTERKVSKVLELVQELQHAALWATQLAATYAPELQLVGVAAAAPPVDLAANLTGNSNATVRALLTAYAGASWSEVYNIPLSTITGRTGQELIRRLAQNCVTLDGFETRTKIGLIRLTKQLRGVDLNSSPRWPVQMRANSVVPRKLDVPLLIAQGSSDLIVSPSVTRAFVMAVCHTGQPVRYLQVAGGDHVTIAKRTAATTINWIADQLQDLSRRTTAVAFEARLMVLMDHSKCELSRTQSGSFLCAFASDIFGESQSHYPRRRPCANPVRHYDLLARRGNRT